MKHLTISAFILLAGAGALQAQEDALLPTHLIDAGSAYVTGTLRYASGSGDASILGTTTGNVDQSAFQYQLEGGVGLGQGFEIQASIYYQFSGETTADFTSVNTEFTTESRGFSDLLIEARYRILQDSKALPQVIAGAIVIAPVGNDKAGQPEIKVNGITTQNKEESGIGQGVWHYGFEAGISKNLVVVEPYLLTSYIFGDKRTQNGVHEDRADTWNMLLGAQWYITEKAVLDTRMQLTRAGTDKSEDNGALVKEESHFTYTGGASLYVHLGGGSTLVFGGGVSFVEDHILNDTVQLGLKDDYYWFLQIGLHVLIGPGKK
jgi:hypothetical protein